MNLRLLSFLICLFSLLNLQGQEQVGLRLNTLTGINASRLNPAAPAITPYRWEINLGEVSAFADNNYFFFRNARLPDLLNKELNKNILISPELANPETMPPGFLVMDFYNDDKRRFAYASSTVMGPSFYYKIDRYNSIGLVTAARFIAGASGVDNDFSYYKFNQLRADEFFQVAPMQAGALGFTEIGLNYTLSSPAPNGSFNLGITAKYLRGYDGAFFSSRKEFDLARIVGNGLEGSGARLKYGYTDNLTSENYELNPTGSGVGIDIGMYATVDGYDSGEYIWKFGFSILDIGEIRFKNTAQRHNIRLNSDPVQLYPEDYAGINDLTDLDQLAGSFSFDVLRDSTATFQDNSISIMLPSAISFQVDHAITSNIFIGGLLLHYLPLGDNGLRRGSLLAIAPRFEHTWVSFNLPVSFYNWQHVRIGAAIRLGPLTVGTDHLGSWFSRKDLYGSDIYAAFSLFPFGKKGRKGGNNGRLPCYSF
ncbi:MAG: hypothetical protein KDD15_26270 [Lewinella sp.]|nr:hypothetical protein [Lewinella sp.]